MKRHHEMPFGAEVREDGSVHFRLWAPPAKQVDVCVAGKNEKRSLSMERQARGWFELVTDAAGAGSRYRYRIDGHQRVPDPASRFQPEDVHGPSEVVDPKSFEWRDSAWAGRRWEDAVLYELHVGTYTPGGTFAGVREKLDYLADLGITAIELMPIADFPGKRNWGYDGVLPYAPDSSYGRPEDLKELVQSAHERGMMVVLDVVYNHFGPEGNYLHAYAPQFFTDRHHTPWGKAINFDGPESQSVRDFFIHNALYWLTEYHFDGLRLDAVNAIVDDSEPHILTELAETVRTFVGRERQVHLILENERNEARYLRRSKGCTTSAFTAQWNDDIHHALHVLITGETEGYYSDYAEHRVERLGRCLAEGFAYQGEASPYRRCDPRGEPTSGLPPGAFISFLQNHDQIGNRAFGDRILKLADPRAVRAAVEILLLAPAPPMLFMGEEFGAETPFLFFCDFENELAAAVTNGRRNEFAHFSQFHNPEQRERIPDPNLVKTFEASRIDWTSVAESRHRQWLDLYRELLQLRCRHVVPVLRAGCAMKAQYEVIGGRGLAVHWRFEDRRELALLANVGPEVITGATSPSMPIIYASGETRDSLNRGILPPWSVSWFLQS